jgi:putative selenate reductase molybdopterin-binding subunit
MSTTSQITLNGRTVEVECDPTESLLRALRDRLGVTGPKPSCEAGHCGACTVLVDGEPARSCLVPCGRTDGASVETVEGIGTDAGLGELQQLLVERGAFQCGFCASGIVVRLSALLRDEPDPDEARIREALGSNLCRCTGYEKLVGATVAFVAGERASDPEATRAMGAPVPQQQAAAKVSGGQVYTGDLALPGMLYARVLRSPHAHAEVVRIDVSRAREVPGVVDVITFEDVPEHRYNPAFRNPNDAETLVPDERVLNEKARFEGDRIAAVAAESERAARAAVALIEVEWRILEPLVEPLAALAGGATEIHAGSSNHAAKPIELAYGEPGPAWEQAEVKIEGTFRIGGQQHANLEPKTSLATWTGERLTLYTTTQVPFHVRTVISHALEIPEADARIIALDQGGGQGERSDPADDFVVVVLARRTGRPVRLTNSREEQFTSTRVRHAAVVESRLGADADGNLVVRDTEATIATGGYAGMGYRVILSLGVRSAALYRVPHIGYRGTVAYTNTPVSGGMRGFGSPQAAFPIESQLDQLAERLEIDPIELRVRNLSQAGDRYLDLDPTWTIQSNEAVQGLRVLRERTAWDRKRVSLREPQPDGLLRGIGVAVGSHISTVMPYYRDHGDAIVQLHENGSVMLTIGVPDTGTGSSTVFAQIAAEAIGLDSEKVILNTGDTDLAPYDQGAHSSRTTYVAGGAVRKAATELKNEVLREAGLYLEVDPGDLEIADGRIAVAGSPARSIGLDDLAHWLRYESDHPRRLVASGSMLPTSIAPPYAIAVAEIAVDPRTGIVRVEAMTEAIDCGRAVNPMFVEGQLHGAMHMGIGAALCEDMLFDDAGRLTTRTFGDYQLLRAADMPKIETVILDSEEPTGPFGAKGLGEASVVPIAPAIANAFAHATGVRPFEMPITPERALELLGRL